MVEESGDVPEEASDARLQWSEWAAYAAFAWALVFAAVHLYWALGGTVGMPPGMSVGMNLALFVIDVVAIPLCVVGALLALSLVRPWGRLLPRRLLLACGWGACALLILHSVPTLVGDGLVIAGLRAGDLSVPERWSLFVYEPWFFAGGVLYGAAALGYGRRSSRSGPLRRRFGPLRRPGDEVTGRKPRWEGTRNRTCADG